MNHEQMESGSVAVKIQIEFAGRSLRGQLFRSRLGEVEFVETDAKGEPQDDGTHVAITEELFSRYFNKIAAELPTL